MNSLMNFILKPFVSDDMILIFYKKNIILIEIRALKCLDEASIFLNDIIFTS